MERISSDIEYECSSYWTIIEGTTYKQDKTIFDKKIKFLNNMDYIQYSSIGRNSIYSFVSFTKLPMNFYGQIKGATSATYTLEAMTKNIMDIYENGDVFMFSLTKTGDLFSKTKMNCPKLKLKID